MREEKVPFEEERIATVGFNAFCVSIIPIFSPKEILADFILNHFDLFLMKIAS